jgi:hypothetical protein
LVRDSDRASRLSSIHSGRDDIDARTKSAQHGEQGRARGVQADVEDLDLGTGQAAAPTSQNAAEEKSPGTVSA